ncbi:MAG: hypothetical protein HY201_05925 [Nitrospirae bacterium]|nr:hypothetical protein [Candidatus Troglogloeales bacterium]
MAVAFSAIGLWIVLLILPGLRRPPPGFEPRVCPQCSQSNETEAVVCEKCGAAL